MNSNGWIGSAGQLYNVLACFGCDRDADGKYHVDGNITSFMGAGDEFVVGPDAVYYRDGKPCNLLAALGATSYGSRVTVIGALLALALTGLACQPMTASVPTAPTVSVGVPAHVAIWSTFERDHATLTAVVSDEFYRPVSGVDVEWSTSVGTLGADRVMTDVRGYASTTLTGQPGIATVLARAGTRSSTTLVSLQRPLAETDVVIVFVSAYTTGACLAVGIPVMMRTSTLPMDLRVVSYRWDFDDGSPTSTAAVPQHVYRQVGVYTPHVTITAADGRTASNIQQVTIQTACQ